MARSPPGRESRSARTAAPAARRRRAPARRPGDPGRARRRARLRRRRGGRAAACRRPRSRSSRSAERLLHRRRSPRHGRRPPAGRRSGGRPSRRPRRPASAPCRAATCRDGRASRRPGTASGRAGPARRCPRTGRCRGPPAASPATPDDWSATVGSGSAAHAAARSWPSVNTSARTVTGSPTVAFAGKAPPSTSGLTASTTTRLGRLRGRDPLLTTAPVWQRTHAPSGARRRDSAERPTRYRRRVPTTGLPFRVYFFWFGSVAWFDQDATGGRVFGSGSLEQVWPDVASMMVADHGDQAPIDRAYPVSPTVLRISRRSNRLGEIAVQRRRVARRRRAVAGRRTRDRQRKSAGDLLGSGSRRHDARPSLARACSSSICARAFEARRRRSAGAIPTSRSSPSRVSRCAASGTAFRRRWSRGRPTAAR